MCRAARHTMNGLQAARRRRRRLTRLVLRPSDADTAAADAAGASSSSSSAAASHSQTTLLRSCYLGTWPEIFVWRVRKLVYHKIFNTDLKTVSSQPTGAGSPTTSVLFVGFTCMKISHVTLVVAAATKLGSCCPSVSPSLFLSHD